jgi:hypothetical protein
MLHGRPDPLSFMIHPWIRKRTAEDVPTPVAVAVADFCRRAGAPAAPVAVRDALSVLAPEEDFRVRTLTDGEPPARPLGPYAVVDVLNGTSPLLAAQREACGYYALASNLLAAESPVPGVARAPLANESEHDAVPAERPPPPQEAPPERPSLRLRPLAVPSVAERIAPRRRLAGSPPPDAAPAPPRGRFTQLPAEQPSLEVLNATDLVDLLSQHGHRPAILRALGTTPGAGRLPRPTAQALDKALERVGLLAETIARERELVLATLEEHRGALGRAAWALGVRTTELRVWVERLGIGAEVDRLREHFRNLALEPAHWTARLDLLGKRKYLEDLGVTADFERALTKDLRQALDTTAGVAEERTAALANRLGVAPEALRRSILRLRLV